ncbi:cytochrome P450 4C1-like isoform X2 [Trichogramma pretiosum]|uniref:cytochrome P450 4C1-like isoform X2 n=1 Tax=Trichogramma pretiosum TaxID=7493 RepID=UPI000C718E91|nr:cytochrome P450 4C1-like isoform X2 [Trichogramma pretiosum]
MTWLDSLMILTTVLAASILVLASLWIVQLLLGCSEKRRNLIRLASKLPGPPTIPLIGNALHFACRPDETLDKVRELAKNYDTPLRFWLGPKLFVVLTEPRDYEVILGCSKASYKDPVYRFMESFVGQGLVSGSGPVHRQHRKVIMPMLNSKTLSEYLKYINCHGQKIVRLLEKRVNGGEFDVQPIIARCTFDIMFDTILGVEANLKKEDYEDLVYWTETIYELIHTRMMKVWLHPDWIFRWTDTAKRLEQGKKVIHTFIESAIAQKWKEHKSVDKPSRSILLEQLIDHVARTDLMTDEQLRDETYTMFTAAQDTTTVICSFAILHLAMNQNIQDKVREEMERVVGTASSIEMEHLNELSYTEMVIKETMRLYPIAPLMVRQARGDISLETCTIPEGCSILMVPFVTHRSAKYWQQPDDFLPERFAPENSSDRHAFAYVPFSAGIRGCIGQKFAMMLLKTIIGHVVRSYRLTSSKTMDDIRLKMDISVRSKDGYGVSIERLRAN